MATEDSAAAERLMRLAARAKVPEAVRTEFLSDPPEPAEGQIWRAKWEDAVELLVLVAVTDDTFTAMPVSLEIDFLTSDAFLLPPEATTLEIPVVVWASLTHDLPIRVLDRLTGQSREPIAATWPSALPNVRRGTTPGTDLHPVFELLAHIEDHMETFVSAAGVPAGSGQLASWLDEAQIPVDELCALLGIPPNQAFAIRRGQRPITRDQAELLAPPLQRPAGEVLAANPSPPPDLIHDLDRPRWMKKVRRLARTRGLSERDAWHTAAFGTFALAARVSGRRQPDDVWQQLLERYFQAALDEA